MLLVGTVRRPHGLSGEVSVEIATAFPERFQPGARLAWRRGQEQRPLILESARAHGDRWLLRFEGVGDPEAARALAGGELCVPGEEAFPAPEGFYYSHRVEGWRCEDPAGRPLGTVAGLESTPAGPLLTVRTPEGKAALVPFVAAIVVEIDEASRRMVLDPPDGLFEI
jgi:16S rRNA processing protein RimM